MDRRFTIIENDGETESIPFDYIFTGTVERALDQVNKDNEIVIELPENVDGSTHYLKRSEDFAALEIPDTPFEINATEVPADAATKITISELLPGTEVSISGPVNTTYTVNDGSISFALPVAGEYLLAITAPFPALSKEVTIYGR